ncbi:MAG: hypothetical protein FWE76_01465, partial [Symbiobacteriaceae bacterium]|nr:hypothetical protein [Symbiobacteriaceae bacterium]
MKSFVNVTHEIDDIQIAVKELLTDTEAENLRQNSVGILFCYSDMATDELAFALQQKACFPILGCTAIATMEHRGFHDLAASLTILSADDCKFITVTTDAITPENVSAQIEKSCRTIMDKLGEEPGLIFALPPYILDIMLDEYASGFNHFAPGVPVFGGLPSYNAIGDRNLTIYQGEVSPDQMVILALAGNVHPVFSVNNVSGVNADRKRKVTHAKDNIIYRVGEQTFTDYLREVGLPVDDLTQGNATITFVSNPLLLENSTDGYSFVRTLHEIDLIEGSGTAIGQIPLNATVSICSLHRSEIEESAASGLSSLIEKMSLASGEEYTFSTVLAVSCIGRHLLMSPNNDAEVNCLLANFPSGLILSGFY